MMKRIKKYYRIKFKLTSPLAVGSGENRITDKDIILDGRGVPYVPASALAGVYRQLFTKMTADKYFGSELTKERMDQSIKEGRNILTESDIVVYNATIIDSAKRVITTRDMVALDEYKVSKDGAKFDFQILEPGITFVTYIEQKMTCEKEAYLLKEIAYAWNQGKISLGAKTGRGYGHTELVELAECCYDLANSKERNLWLDFDMYGDNDWTVCGKDDFSDCLSGLTPSAEKYQEVKNLYALHGIQKRKNEELKIVLDLKQCGGISVRQYSTEVGDADYEQLTYHGDRPVIPGTSWAGAFREQMEKLDKEFQREARLTELLFGKVKKNDAAGSHKTRITFSESEIKNGHWEVYTRNAVDRFTGGVVEQALYTERTYFNGKTRECISCDMTGIDKNDVEYFGTVMAAAILDLDSGFMSVGGLTAVGHGLFTVEEITINGRKIGYTSLEKDKKYVVLKTLINGEEDQAG